jgi:hypothetical protein
MPPDVRPPGPLPYEGVWRFTAPAVDASVPQARHAVRDLLARQGVPVSDELVQGLLLIVSELVTNAVRHAALLSPMLAVEIAVGAEWCGSPSRTTTPTARPPWRPTTARQAAVASSWSARSRGRQAESATWNTRQQAAR